MRSTTRRIASGAGVAVALTALSLLPAGSADAAPQRLGAVAIAAEEATPPAASDLGAIGTVDMTIDGVTGDVCVNANLAGLGGAIVAAHIHQGAPGVNGPIVVPLPSTATTVSGCTQTTPAQAQAILATPNNYYFNAHTTASPAGAIRGQLTTAIYEATLAGGANEIPGPGDPDGTGTAVAAIDTTANRACVYTSTTNIDLPAILAHIHSGAAGVAGPVVVGLTAPATATAASCGAAGPGIAPAIVASPSAFYVNIHTTPFPGGAIRGQLVPRTGAVPPVPVLIVNPPATTTTTTPASTTTIAATTTTTAPATTTTTTSSTTTTTVAPTTLATTTALPAETAAPADAVEATPSFTG